MNFKLMKCKYCYRQCYSEVSFDNGLNWVEAGAPVLPDNGEIRHRCDHCWVTYRTHYQIWKDIKIKNRAYLVKLYDGETGNAPQFIVYAGCTDDWGDFDDWEEIIRWDFIPESWSPQNIEEHLAKLLTFL